MRSQQVWVANCRGCARTLCWTLPVELWTHFSRREITHYEHSKIQTRTVWRAQRALNKFEFQCVAGVRAPFARPCLLNFELICLQDKWITMNIQQFKLEQFDVAYALATSLSCNLSRVCTHSLLNPTCWTWNSFFAKRNESLWTFINSN